MIYNLFYIDSKPYLSSVSHTIMMDNFDQYNELYNNIDNEDDDKRLLNLTG